MDYEGKATVRLQWNTVADPKLRAKVKQWQVQLSQSPSFGTVELDSTVDGSKYTYTAKFSLRKRTRSPLICAPLFVRVRAIGKSGATSAWSSVADLAIRGLFTGNFISNIVTTQYRSGALRFTIGYYILSISSMRSFIASTQLWNGISTRLDTTGKGYCEANTIGLNIYNLYTDELEYQSEVEASGSSQSFFLEPDTLTGGESYYVRAYTTSIWCDEPSLYPYSGGSKSITFTYSSPEYPYY